MHGEIFSSDRAWRNRSRLDALVGDQGFGVRQRGQDGRGAAIVADPLPGGLLRSNRREGIITVLDAVRSVTSVANIRSNTPIRLQLMNRL
jgi:hypothetical protein